MKSDKRTKITVNLDDDVLWGLFHEAHHRDITLNQLVNDILSDIIKRTEKERVRSKKDRVSRDTGVGKDKHRKSPRRTVRD